MGSFMSKVIKQIMQNTKQCFCIFRDMIGIFLPVLIFWFIAYLLIATFAKADEMDGLDDSVLENKHYFDTMDFIEYNEGYANHYLQAYKNKHDVWTICAGLTFYITTEKMTDRKCRLLDRHNKSKGYVCPVKKGDRLSGWRCEGYQRTLFKYFDNKLKKNLMPNHYNKLYSDGFFYKIAMDLLWCYGESNKQVKKVFTALQQLADTNFRSKAKMRVFYKNVKQLKKTKHKTFHKGIDNRIKRYFIKKKDKHCDIEVMEKYNELSGDELQAKINEECRNTTISVGGDVV